MEEVKMILRFKKRRHIHRLLREFEYTAYTSHFCDYCMHEIQPGDRYRGRVFITDNGIFTFREHYNPPCPVDPEEEEREMLERDKRETEREEKEAQDQQVPAAA